LTSGDAAESLGVVYPYRRLKEEGYEVHTVAPSKKTLHFVVHDPKPGYDTYTEKPGYSHGEAWLQFGTLTWRLLTSTPPTTWRL